MPNEQNQNLLKNLRKIIEYISKRFVTNPRGFSQTILYDAKYIFTELIFTRRFSNRNQLFVYSLQHSKPNGLLLEFGVAYGTSTNYLASLVPNETIYGFDCFTGLPEKWGIMPKGHFKIKVLPQVRKNVKLVVGMFQDTLDNFLVEHEEKVRFLHLDADLYSSTIYVLKTLIMQKRIQEGTVIQFDELFNYVNWWKDGEFKALRELTKTYHIKYEILGFSLLEGYGPGQVAIRIINIG